VKSWSAILDRGLKKRAREVIPAIAQALRESSRASVPDEAAFACSLASGLPGLAVLYACLAESEIVSDAEERLIKLPVASRKRVSSRSTNAMNAPTGTTTSVWRTACRA
jgi:hypothetical protein